MLESSVLFFSTYVESISKCSTSASEAAVVQVPFSCQEFWSRRTSCFTQKCTRIVTRSLSTCFYNSELFSVTVHF